MTTLQQVELGVLGPLEVRQYGLPVAIPGAKPRAILTMLGLHGGSMVSADTLVELLWGADPPRTAAKALQTHISSLRRALGDGFVMTQGLGWTLRTSEIDAFRYRLAAKVGREAFASGDVGQAVTRFDEALTLWRGIPELPDGARGVSEKTRWIEGHAALVEDRADALLATGKAAEIIGELEAAIADAPLRERRWGHLMLAFYRAGRQGDALGAYQRARSLLADELGVEPGPDLRRLEAAIVAQDDALELPVSQHLSVVTRAVTFLLTDIEGSTAAWEADADAMAVALARHDEIVEQVVTSRGGRLIKTRGEGDATFSVFDRPSAAAAAAIELQEAIRHEQWALAEPVRIRVALHTGEVELRDGDYFGRAVNRAARLRSLAAGGQILCSGATAELVIDTLADDVVLADLGMRQLKNLARPEHVFELRLETVDDSATPTPDVPMERPSLPPVLAGPGPFVGRASELERLMSAYQLTLDEGTSAVLIAGEPGVGKTRLAGEWSRQAFEQGAVVLYGRCDEDLGAPYQPFAEALRSLVPCLGADRLRGLRGVEALLALVPGLTDALPDLAAPPRADPDTERYALFDTVVAVLGVASTSAPVVLILDDLHWAAKPTLLLLRHLLRFGDHARVQIVGTYRSTDLDRSHPLAAMLADLHRDGSANRLQLSGLDEDDVTAYVAEAGYDDEDLARALASVTGGNPFFLIEALRHVDESGGRWDQSTLPQGVREAVSRRLSRLPAETNKALAAAAVVGSRFALDLVERVVEQDLIDAFDEACKAGIVIEEPGGRYRFNHALVRQSLLAELASVRRMRLHQRIAATLETEPGADDELLAELAYHYFECAWAGNAAKAVDYCRRAADQAMARLAYEGAADLYDKALHALEELDDELPDREDQQAELLVARCEALLAAGDVASARGAVSQLQAAAGDSARLAAWGTCFDGQLSMLTDPERLDDIESAVGEAAEKLAELDDAAGEAKAHTVRAGCLARLGRIGDCEAALDQALTAARRAREHRRVNAVLANAPLAALWGPNPVPRAGGRCLDVVRLLRITTGSPVVEATSTRCQGVLDAFRGRAAAGRQLIDSARRSLTELGMRHALLEVDQFAGIVELVADDPAAAEPHLRRAYNGFRRMGLDADTAETAALLARACLELGRDVEAEELCTESERLAGHALKASIAWRTVRAQLLTRSGDHDDARRMAEDAVAVAGRTDLLVDHGDACLTLATVLDAAGDAVAARAVAEQAVSLYELKGAAALAEKARKLLGDNDIPAAPAAPEPSIEDMDNACVRALRRLDAAFDREAWGELEEQVAPVVTVESRRKIVGMTRGYLPSDEWARGARSYREVKAVRHRHVVLAVRGERLALTRLEIGTADVSPGAPRDEHLQLFGLDNDGRITLQVFFDSEDLDAAIAELDAAYARLEEAKPRGRRLENAASQVDERLWTFYAARDWAAMSQILGRNVSVDDRRSVVGAGIREGRDALIDEMQAVASEFGIMNTASVVIATRGEHLALRRARYTGRDQRPEAFHIDVLRVIEIYADDRIAVLVTFDADDVDAAFEELDARYLAGEAAAHADTWSVITQGYAAANRGELAATSPDVANIDHRQLAMIETGELIPYLRDTFDDLANISTYLEAVHRLTDFGAVVTHVGAGTSREGFDGEWRLISVIVVDGSLVSRSETFDEADLDAALAKFDELSRPAPRLENAATNVEGRFQAYFAARDWAAVGEILAADISADDRRRVVNAGIRHGRDAKVADMRVTADLGTENGTSTVIAIRGQRLALVHIRLSGRDQRPDAFHAEMLGIAEIDADSRMAARVLFDVDDLDAAFEELDARYLAGEAAAHAHTWSVVADAYAAFNRRELLAVKPDWVNIDHRRGAAFAPGDMIAYIQAAWDDTPDTKIYIAAVHRLSNLGAVVTHVAHGISHEGFDAEWRDIHVVTVKGDTLGRCELFDEADLDAALARFDELSRPAPRLENAASRTYERLQASFAARAWDVMAEIFADEASIDDRRHVVNAGIRRGRDINVADMRSVADIAGTQISSNVLATRGESLVLSHVHVTTPDQWPGAFRIEFLSVVEVGADGRIVARVVFEPDDLDTAIEELDARYLAGEAAEHAHTWSVVSEAYAAVNRHELPTWTPDFVNIDHRRTIAFAPGELAAYLHATWDQAPNVRVYIETVHRLSVTGALVTHVAKGITPQGFEGEWREITLSTVEGELINHSEMFDEADIDAALAKFGELSRPAPRLENTASRVGERYFEQLAAGDWDAITDLVADNFSQDDRRRIVGAGVRHGLDAQVSDIRAFAELSIANVTPTVIATRGERLVLSRVRFSFSDQGSEAYVTELIGVGEINTDEKITAAIAFDPDDIDAALAELDARYLAGEAAGHAHTWSVIAQGLAAFNRRELPGFTPDSVNIDHRRARGFAPGDLTAYIGATWDVAPDVIAYAEAVNRLSNLGAVWTHAVRGTSQDGFDAEWREICLATVEGDLISRIEMFDEADLDAALDRFERLSQQAPRLQNAATQVSKRFLAHFAARDWDAIADAFADGYSLDDRRRTVNSGVRQGRDSAIEDMRTAVDVGLFASLSSAVIATRGERLVLIHLRALGHDPEAIQFDVLIVIETDADERFAAAGAFDVDDIDAAFEELDARYLAGEAAEHSHTWSVIARACAAFNRHVLPPTTPDWVNIDHRKVTAFAPGDMTAYMRATFGVAPEIRFYIEAVHRLTDLVAVFTQAGRGISHEGFEAEWRDVVLMSIEGDQFNRCEVFDDTDLEAALATLDELSRQVPPLENAATRTRARLADAFNRRDRDTVLAMAAADGRYEDRRMGLRDEAEGRARDNVAHALFEAVPATWRSEVEPIAIRGSRLSVTRDRYRDTADPDQPIVVELLTIMEVDDDELVCHTVLFEPDDIIGAISELTARWIALGEVAHPDVIEAALELFEAANRHDWDALVSREAGATHVNHRQLASGADTIVDHWSSLRMTASLIPDMWIELAEILTDSAIGVVTGIVVKGTTAEGAAIELPAVILILFDGARVTRMEAFDPDQRDSALARFEELNRAS